LESKFFLQKWVGFYGRLAVKILKSPTALKSFSTGNGDKLIKRLLTIVRSTSTPLPDEIFRWILYDKPGLRKELFLTWSRTGVTKNQVDRLIGFLHSGQAVDDMVYILSVVAMSQTRFGRRISNKQFSLLRLALKDKEPSLLYARLLLVSRFETVSLLWSEISSTFEIWSRHKFLSRQVCGFSSLMWGTAHWDEYRELVNRWAGPEGMSVFDFHEGLRSSVQAFRKVQQFLKAPNPTSGTALTHAKALMILSVVQNHSIPKIERAKLVGSHPTMMSDTYYMSVFSAGLSAMK
jgi:hypothetical protein